MPKNVMCKNCNNYRCDWCEKVVDSPDPNMPRTCQYFWERTNADRIRAMSDEELAQMLNKAIVCHTLRSLGYCHKCPLFGANPCDTEGLLEWIKQPAE